MFDPIYNARLARERYQDLLREAELNRLASRARQGQLSLPRRAARPIGRVLLRLGIGLLRYGLVETLMTTRPYHPSARSIEMN